LALSSKREKVKKKREVSLSLVIGGRKRALFYFPPIGRISQLILPGRGKKTTSKTDYKQKPFNFRQKWEEQIINFGLKILPFFCQNTIFTLFFSCFLQDKIFLLHQTILHQSQKGGVLCAKNADVPHA
jgi:hypothetical protein